MGSTFCCTSLKPPSPDGLCPKPITVTPSKSRAILSKVSPLMMASWSTRLSQPEDAAQLRAIFEDNLCEEGYDRGKMKSMKAKMSFNTLNAVANAMTTKLRKHFSRDLALSKRLSRSSVGNSEEDIERRKELRRLRDKRIQEELSMDNFDDDAASLSTVVSSNKLPTGPHTTSPQQVTYKEMPSECADRSMNLLYATVPGVPFGEIAKLAPDESFEVSPDALRIVKRRHSLGCISKPANLIEQIRNCYTPPRKHSHSIMPPGPVLCPQRLPSITDSAIRRTSWRLSFTSDQRSCQLRTLIQDPDTPVETTKISDVRSELTDIKWLRGQGLRIPSQAVTNPSDNASALDASPSHQFHRRGTTDFGGVDGNLETQQAPIHLWEMRIPQRLASRELYNHASSPQLSSWGSHAHYRVYSTTSNGSRFSKASRYRHRKTSSSGACCKANPKSWSDGVCQKTSSIYPSNIHSILPTPTSSRLEISSVVDCTTDNLILESTSHKALELAVVSSDPSIMNKNINANVSATSLAIPSVESDRQLTLTSSIIASETASFRQREEELKFIEIRFPDLTTKDIPSAAVSSKFTEEFEVSLPPPAKSSIFSVLQLSRKLSRKATRKARARPKTYDGAVSLDNGRTSRSQGYGYSFADRTPSSTVNKRYHEDLQTRETPATEASGISPRHIPGESATAMWARIITRTQREHSDRVRENLKLPEAKGTGWNNKSRNRLVPMIKISDKLKGKQRTSEDEDVGYKGNEIQSDDGRDKGESLLLGRGADLEHQDDVMGVSNFQVQQETLLMEKTPLIKEAQLCRETTPVHSLQREGQARQTTTPESWARYPSHTRTERSGPASISDDVYPQDFANQKGVKCKNLPSDSENSKNEYDHNINVKIGKRIRCSWYKLIWSKMDFMNNSIGSHRRKGSTSAGRTLEAPELEILPLAGGLKGIREAEEDAEQEMRINERISRMASFVDGSSRHEIAGAVDEVDGIVNISIANPSFYADCVLNPLIDDPNDGQKSMKSGDTTSSERLSRRSFTDKGEFKKEKYKTWSGRDRGSKSWLWSLNMRRSTIDFTVELEQMERFERDRVIKSAEMAWGTCPLKVHENQVFGSAS